MLVLLGIRGSLVTLIWQYMGLKECCGRRVVGTSLIASVLSVGNVR
jgi:hypothetical protein